MLRFVSDMIYFLQFISDTCLRNIYVLFQLTVGNFTESDMSANMLTVICLMSVGDTEFSPPATAVHFLVCNSSHHL